MDSHWDATDKIGRFLSFPLFYLCGTCKYEYIEVMGVKNVTSRERESLAGHLERRRQGMHAVVVPCIKGFQCESGCSPAEAVLVFQPAGFFQYGSVWQGWK